MRTHCLVATIALAALAVPAAASNAAGKEFLAKNGCHDDVTTQPSGLQYRVVRAGEGNSHPTLDSPCEVHYEGRTATQYPSGATFDSSYQRGEPATFVPNQVIGGWTEAMQLMVEGAKWELFIPSELGYGEAGSPPDIGGGDVLCFTMEILRITGEKVPAKRGGGGRAGRGGGGRGRGAAGLRRRAAEFE